MKFLKREVKGEEKLRLARSDFEIPKVNVHFRDKHKDKKRQNKLSTATSLLTNKEFACIFL